MLNLNGLWEEVVVDDYLPVFYNLKRELDSAFSHTVQCELWVQLIEKAYAKKYGSYYLINGGYVVYALRDLTGAPIERINDFKDLATVFEKV
jgi:Calpain family cysteine protease